MWLTLAFFSATFLGFYDVFKKISLKDNAVLPVLFFNTLFCGLLFLPLILVSHKYPDLLNNTLFYVPKVGSRAQLLICVKSVIVLTSWVFGYYGMKHLPITIVGPINATRPVMTLVGAMLIFGERLNAYQWAGVLLALASLYLLSLSGKKEGINFQKNKWIIFVALSAIAGACSGLYDKFLLQRVEPMAVQAWFNTFSVAMEHIIHITIFIHS